MVCSALDVCICTYVWNTAIVSPVHSICLISMSHLTTCAASLCLPLSHTHTCTAVVPCCFTGFKLYYLLIQSVFCVCGGPLICSGLGSLSQLHNAHCSPSRDDVVLEMQSLS